MSTNTDSFLGRYRLVKVLGQGAMGVVYEAVDTRLNRTVAIKTVLRSHMADETTATEYATRFEREAQAAARLSHPHVVTVYDFGEHEDISYIVMEFIRGRELNQAFEAGQTFPLPEVVRIMRELLSALDYAHQQGIVHRDIKPANVMLDGAGHVKLTDFGVARVANANQDRTMPGTLVGTPSYMSPEQILGLAVGSRADIFAAGVILYQFLTGKRPFSGGGPFGVQRKIVQDDPDAPSKVNPSLPPGFDAIISKALAKQPENRYENAAAFAADLERIGATLPRDVPLIDLDLADDPTPTHGGSGSMFGTSATASRPPPPAPRPAPPPPAPPPPSTPAPAMPDLTLITVAPFGGPAPSPAVHDGGPTDPEATIVMTQSRRPDAGGTAGSIGPGLGTPSAASATPAPALRTQASVAAPRAAPVPSAATPRPAPAAPAAATTAHSAPVVPPSASPSHAPAPAQPRRAPAAPAAQATSRAAAPPEGREHRGGELRRRPAWVPLAAGAVVALLALAGWLVVARPWAAKPAASAALATPPAVGVAAPPAVTPTQSTGAASATPTPAPAVVAQPAPSGTTTAPGPAATRPEAAPRPEPTPRSQAPSTRPANDTTTARPLPARPESTRPAGLEPRCSDLLQRMQLGEPLTADQTTYFQTRCTR